MPYSAPTSAAEAAALLSEARYKIVAGCTDVFPALPQGGTAQAMLDLTRIPDLQGVHRTARGWRIGAAATWSDVAKADLPPAFDGLKQAARQVGSLQIQNRGTVAGNICNASPAADGVPPLLTLGSVVEVLSTKGTRLIPLDAFITGVRSVDLADDEFVTAVHIPDIPDTARSAFSKLGSRTHMVISIAMVAAIVEWDGDRIAQARVAVGSCSAVAQRLPAFEAWLVGKRPHDIDAADLSVDGLLAPLSPISDVRGTAGYRLCAAQELCKRTILATSQE